MNLKLKRNFAGYYETHPDSSGVFYTIEREEEARWAETRDDRKPYIWLVYEAKPSAIEGDAPVYEFIASTCFLREARAYVASVIEGVAK